MLCSGSIVMRDFVGLLDMWDFAGLFGGASWMVWRRRFVWRCCCDKDEVLGMAWPDGVERMTLRRKCEENNIMEGQIWRT